MTWLFPGGGAQGLVVIAAPGLPVPVAALVAEHGLSCSVACGVFQYQELNPCLLRWQVDSLLLSHQGTP